MFRGSFLSVSSAGYIALGRPIPSTGSAFLGCEHSVGATGWMRRTCLPALWCEPRMTLFRTDAAMGSSLIDFVR